VLGKCEARTVMTWYRNDQVNGDRCSYYARFTVNGKQLCRIHAERERAQEESNEA